MFPSIHKKHGKEKGGGKDLKTFLFDTNEKKRTEKNIEKSIKESERDFLSFYAKLSFFSIFI